MVYNHDMKTKIACIFLIITILVQLAGCGKTEPSSQAAADNNCDMSSEDYVCGNGDVENLYFKSAVCSIKEDGLSNYHAACFRSGDCLCAVLPCFNEETFDSTVKVYLIDFDGNIRSSFELEDAGITVDANAPKSADWNGERIICAGHEANYMVHDYSGELIARAGGNDPELGETRALIGWGDTFVIVTDKGAIRYDWNCKEIGRIVFGFQAFDSWTDPGIVVQRNKVYMSGVAGMVYELDFDAGQAVYKGILNNAEGLPKTYQDFTRSTNECFSISTYFDPSYYWEADLENMTVHKTAKASNIMFKPPRYECDYLTNNVRYTDPLDKLHYVHVYNYDPADNMDIDIEIISPDNDSNYASREKITCRGFGVFEDSLIRRAQYMFNSSQDQYYLELQDWGGGYDLSVPDQADKFRLEVMSDIQNGNAPDIFYGNDFDYLYWGDNGTVLDMKPYLEANGGFDADSISPNMLDLMTGNDGAVYQVFPKYILWGYWGRQKDYGDMDLSIETLASGKIPDGYNKPVALELLYGAFSNNLLDLYQKGELTEENVRMALAFAVDLGTEQQSYGEYDRKDIEDNTDASSFVDEEVSSVSDYYYLSRTLGDYPVYIGAPSIGCTVRTVMPESLVAVYSGTKHPEAACKVVSYLLDTDFQRAISMCNYSGIPVNRNVLDELIGYMEDPDSIPDDIRRDYGQTLCLDTYIDNGKEKTRIVPLDKDVADSFLRQTGACNTISKYDWGIKSIISEELDSYYSQGKSIDEVAKSLCSRLKLYISE